VKDKHVKDAAQNLTEGVMQGVVEDVLSTAQGANRARHILAAEPTPNTRLPAPTLSLG